MRPFVRRNSSKWISEVHETADGADLLVNRINIWTGKAFERSSQKMTDQLRNEEGPAEVTQAKAREAARQFASSLAAAPQDKSFDLARQQLRQDAMGQQATQDFQRQQQYLLMMQTWGTVSQADQDELQRLYERMMEIPTVQRYVHCQEELARMFQEVALLIGQVIGTDFPPQRSGCCG